MPPHHHRHHKHGHHGRHGGGPDEFGAMQTILDTVIGPDYGFELARMASHGPPEIRGAFQAAVCALAGQRDALVSLGGDPAAVCAGLLTWDQDGLPALDSGVVAVALDRVCSPVSSRRTLQGLKYGPDEVVALGIVATATAVLAWTIADRAAYAATSALNTHNSGSANDHE